MDKDRCEKCNKEFLWWWRHKHSCAVCHSVVCSGCLGKDYDDRRVCDSCHKCSKCDSIVHYKSLQVVSYNELDNSNDIDNSENLDNNRMFTSLRWDKVDAIYYEFLCPKCYKQYRNNINNWVRGTKQEFLRGYSIVKEIGLIKIDEECESPADVEHRLQVRCALLGGNSYIKLFWDKHIEHHQEEYEAGRGHNGNPYYRTKHYTTQHFTGHAISVVAKKIKKHHNLSV